MWTLDQLTVMAVQLAGVALLALALSNVFAYEKLGWSEELVRCGRFFGQVFKVHTWFIVLTLIAMGAACLGATTELINGETSIAKGAVWFMALFWGSRVLLHVFYYDKKLIRENVWWNLLFLSTFVYLSTVFWTLVIL